MADIFGKTPKSATGGFSVDKATLSFPELGATGTSGLLIQNVQISYQQQVSFVYDLAKADDVYYIAGRASGTLALGKIVGSQGIVKTFYTKFGDVCQVNGKSLTLSGLAGCSGTTAQTGTIEIKEPIITQFGLTMNVDTAIIGENVQMIFATLKLA
jgi:hypothetical protein